MACMVLALFSVTHINDATAQTKKKRKTYSIYSLVKAQKYSRASRRLKKLYANYPQSVNDERQFIKEVSYAVRKLPEKHERNLEKFLERNSDNTAGVFMSGYYSYRTGLEARGFDTTENTDSMQMNILKSNFSASMDQFQIVLDEEPHSYLAHYYRAIMQAYISKNKKSNAEFKEALALSPVNYRVWDSFLYYNQPRWGGSYAIMDELIEEIAFLDPSNPKLTPLKGTALAEKARNFLLNEDYAAAEDHIFQALDFGSKPTYGKLVDRLMRTVRKNGDEVSACRIIKKTHNLYPNHKRYKKLAAECG